MLGHLDNGSAGRALSPSAASSMVAWLYRSERSSSDQLKGTLGSEKEKEHSVLPPFSVPQRGFRSNGDGGVAGCSPISQCHSFGNMAACAENHRERGVPSARGWPQPVRGRWILASPAASAGRLCITRSATCVLGFCPLYLLCDPEKEASPLWVSVFI